MCRRALLVRSTASTDQNESRNASTMTCDSLMLSLVDFACQILRESEAVLTIATKSNLN